MGLDFDKLIDMIHSKKDVEAELKQCGRLPIDGPGPNGWTAGRVAAILCNPTYTGIGAYPSLVTDDFWIKCACKSLEELGPELFFRIMIDSLRQSLE